MTSRTFRSAAAVGLALLLGAGTAGATAMFRLDVRSLAKSADVIVRGTVTRVQSRWTADHQRIVTDVDIQVAESLKGTPGEVVRVLQPGGEVDGIGQKVSGLASFSTGEEVVVFLQQHGPVFQVSGMSQGKFSVQRSSDGTSAFAVPAPTDAVLIDPVTRAPVPATQQAVELEGFKREVHQALKADKAGGQKVTP